MVTTAREILEAERRQARYSAQHLTYALDGVIEGAERLMRNRALSGMESGMAANASRRAQEARLNVLAVVAMLDDQPPASAAPGPSCDTLAP